MVLALAAITLAGPSDLTWPDKLPIFAFMSGYPILKRELDGIGSACGLHGSSQVVDWTYVVNVPLQKVSRDIRRRLGPAIGWTVKTPEIKVPQYVDIVGEKRKRLGLTASYTAKGGEKWFFEAYAEGSKGHGLNSGKTGLFFFRATPD